MGAALFAYDTASVTKMKTKARTVTQTYFTIVSKFGEYFRTPTSKSVYTYDNAGRLIESSSLTPRDVLEDKITNSYDALGNLSSQVCADAEGKTLWTTSVSYKDALKSELSEFTPTGSLKAKTIYSYTERKLTDESYYNAEGALLWKIIYKYAPNGKIEVEYEYDEDGILYDERRYSYTDSNLLDAITYYDVDGKMKIREVFRYASDKSLNEITTYDSKNTIIKRSVVKQDSFGNVSRITGYDVSRKFGTTVNEMSEMSEYIYDYNVVDAK